MAEKIVLVLDLEKGDFDKPFGELIKDAEKAGSEAGKKAQKGFNKKFSGLREGLNKSVASSAKSLVGLAKNAALAGAAVAGVFTAKAIGNAVEQENAVNRLNTALRVNGDFSEQASQDLQNYASQLQSTTKFGDEAILNQLALAKSFGATNEQAKEIVTASADLAEALGTDLESATRNVAKTLGGFAGELGEQIPALKNLTKEQLAAGEGIRVLGQQFAGTAQSRVKTFSGGLTQLGNTFGDLLEELGFLVTKSPAVLKTIEFLNGAFQRAVKAVKEFASSFSFGRDIILPTIQVAKTISETLVPAFELGLNIGDIFVQSLKTGFNALGFAASSAISAIVGGLATITGSDTLRQFADDSKTAADTFKTNWIESAEATRTSVQGVFDFPLSEQTNQRLEEVEQFYTEVEARAALSGKTLEDQSNQNRKRATENIKTFSDFSSGVFGEFDEQVEKTNKGIQKQIADTNKSVVDFSKKTANALKNGVGTAAGNAFASFGAALANGENALEAFGKAFVKQIANVAVQQGTSFILQGIGYLFVPGFQSLGSSLIAAGAGLAAFGGALGAVVSGGGSSGAGSSAGVSTANAGTAIGTDFSQDPSTATPEQSEARAEQTAVNLTIQGDVLDSEESGTRIASILSDAFERDGIVLNDAGVA